MGINNTNFPPLTDTSHGEALRYAFEDTCGALGVINSFIIARPGRKILRTTPTDLTEVYTYKQGEVTLFVVTLTYTDLSKNELASVERTA